MPVDIQPVAQVDGRDALTTAFGDHSGESITWKWNMKKNLEKKDLKTQLENTTRKYVFVYLENV